LGQEVDESEFGCGQVGDQETHPDVVETYQKDFANHVLRPRTENSEHGGSEVQEEFEDGDVHEADDVLHLDHELGDGVEVQLHIVERGLDPLEEFGAHSNEGHQLNIWIMLHMVGDQVVSLMLILPHAHTDPTKYVGNDGREDVIVIPDLSDLVVTGIVQQESHLLITKGMQKGCQKNW
jgi:hypothetical protein